MLNTCNMGQLDYSNYNNLPPFKLNSTSSPDTNSAFEEKETTKTLSYEERIKIEELKEKAEKELKLHSKIAELEKQQAAINKNMKPDGSSTYSVPRSKKDSFWNKAGRWLSNAGTAVANIGKSFIGYDEDGWHPEKMLKNVAIAAAAVGATFIPVVGPAIGYGLLAAGAIGGGVGIVKGFCDLDHARTDVQKDKAQQEICANAITTGLSIFGLRGLGKGLRTNPDTSSLASSATEKSTMLGRAGESMSNFFKDSTVNAFRATKQAIAADKTLITSSGGFGKAYKAKFSESWKGFNDRETIYANKKQGLENSLETRLQKIDSQLSTETNAAKKALLNEEKQMLEMNLQEVRSLGTNIKSKAEFDALLKDNSGTFNREDLETYGKYVNDNAIAPKRMQLFKSRIDSMQKSYVKQLKQLVKAKEKEMRALAKHPNKHLSKLNDYVPTRTAVTKKWYKPKTYTTNEYQAAIGGKNTAFGEILTKGYTLAKTPAAVATFTADRWTTPLYSAPFLYGSNLTPDETTTMLESIEQQIAFYDECKKAIGACTKEEELNAIIAQINGMESGAATQPEATSETPEQNNNQEETVTEEAS